MSYHHLHMRMPQNSSPPLRDKPYRSRFFGGEILPVLVSWCRHAMRVPLKLAQGGYKTFPPYTLLCNDTYSLMFIIETAQ